MSLLRRYFIDRPQTPVDYGLPPSECILVAPILVWLIDLKFRKKMSNYVATAKTIVQAPKLDNVL